MRKRESEGVGVGGEVGERENNSKEFVSSFFFFYNFLFSKEEI